MKNLLHIFWGASDKWENEKVLCCGLMEKAYFLNNMKKTLLTFIGSHHAWWPLQAWLHPLYKRCDTKIHGMCLDLIHATSNVAYVLFGLICNIIPICDHQHIQQTFSLSCHRKATFYVIQHIDFIKPSRIHTIILWRYCCYVHGFITGHNINIVR